MSKLSSNGAANGTVKGANLGYLGLLGEEERGTPKARLGAALSCYLVCDASGSLLA